jgi:hypothetical protein
MKEFFSGLSVVSGDIKTETINESISCEFNGIFTMSKGNLKQEFSYYARMYKHRYFDNIVSLDDWECTAVKTILGELPIDNLHSFKQTLIGSGLTTLANSLNFSSDDEKKSVLESIKKNKTFYSVYGPDANIWETISKEEQNKLNLGYVIKNYDTCNNIEKHTHPYGICLDEDNRVATKEELTERLVSLT